MQQSKRTAAPRVILGTPQSLYFWPSIGLRWPKRKGAAEHCAYVPIAARPQPTVWVGVVEFRRSVVHVGAPHSPRVRYALDRFRARLTAFRREVPTAVEELECGNPTTGMARWCTRTATRHAVTVPPSRLMNSRH